MKCKPWWSCNNQSRLPPASGSSMIKNIKKERKKRMSLCFWLQYKRRLKDVAVSVAGNRNHRKKVLLWNAMVVLLLKRICSNFFSRAATHSKITLKSLNKFGRFTLSNFKTYHKVIKLIITVCYLQKDKHIDQQNK